MSIGEHYILDTLMGVWISVGLALAFALGKYIAK